MSSAGPFIDVYFLLMFIVSHTNTMPLVETVTFGGTILHYPADAAS